MGRSRQYGDSSRTTPRDEAEAAFPGGRRAGWPGVSRDGAVRRRAAIMAWVSYPTGATAWFQLRVNGSRRSTRGQLAEVPVEGQLVENLFCWELVPFNRTQCGMRTWLRMFMH